MGRVLISAAVSGCRVAVESKLLALAIKGADYESGLSAG